MKIYGLTVVCSKEYIDGRESQTQLFKSEEERNKEVWDLYADEITNNSEYIENVIDDKNVFIKTLISDGYVVGQWSEYRMQWEIFEQEI